MTSRLSVQLYSLRHISSLEEQLNLVRQSGLTHVEATTSNYADPQMMREICTRNGLSIPSGHIGIDRLRSDFDGSVEIASLLGMEMLVLWGLPDNEMPNSIEGWHAAGKELGVIAERLAERDLKFAFHNHDWELQPFAGGACGLDHLFLGAGKAPLLWQADLAWLARDKADVDAIVEQHAGRLISAHVKDLAPVGEKLDEDGWADLGDGILPWTRWWKRLRELKVDLLVLEHDEPNNPPRFLERSSAFARQLDLTA